MRSQIQTLSNTEFWNCNAIYTDLLQEAFVIHRLYSCNESSPPTDLFVGQQNKINFTF